MYRIIKDNKRYTQRNNVAHWHISNSFWKKRNLCFMRFCIIGCINGLALIDSTWVPKALCTSWVLKVWTTSERLVWQHTLLYHLFSSEWLRHLPNHHDTVCDMKIKAQIIKSTQVRSRAIFSQTFIQSDFFQQPDESPAAGHWKDCRFYALNSILFDFIYFKNIQSLLWVHTLNTGL